MGKISSTLLLVFAGLVAYLALKPGSSDRSGIPTPTLQSQDAPTLIKIADARSQNEAIESRLAQINQELSIFSTFKRKPKEQLTRAERFQPLPKGATFTINPFTGRNVLIGTGKSGRPGAVAAIFGGIADINQIRVAREFQSNLLTERAQIQSTSRQNTLFLSSVGL